MRSVLTACAFGLIAAAAAVPTAQAEIVTVTYKGFVAAPTIYSNTQLDLTGLFGVTGGTYYGDPFTAVLKFDTSVGYTDYAGSNQDAATGGGLFGNTSPSLGASITINGHTQNVYGSYYGDIEASNTSLVHTATYYNGDAGGIDASSGLGFNSYSSGTFPTKDVSQPFTYTFQPGDISHGVFVSYVTDGGYDVYSNFSVHTYILLSPTTVTESIGGISGVPEPSTWAMMLLGFFGLACAALSKARGREVNLFESSFDAQR